VNEELGPNAKVTVSHRPSEDLVAHSYSELRQVIYDRAVFSWLSTERHDDYSTDVPVNDEPPLAL
jgi:hypothetical protein